MHCKLAAKYTKIGAINPDFEVSKRLVKVTYTTIAEKDSVSVSNLYLMKETSHKQLHFSDDYDTEQLNQIKIMKQKAKLQNKENKESSVYYCVRGKPSKNLRIVPFMKRQ